MNLFRTRMFLRIDPLARIHPPYVCPVHTTPPAGSPPPLRTPCPVITPEPAIHRQMNSRSELKSSYHVSSSITFHLSCLAFDCYDCFIFIVSPPLFYCPIVSTTDADAPVFDYVVYDRTPPTVELPGKQSHSPLPYIAYFSIIICCTRHMLLLRYFPIQMHSLSLSPLVVPFLYPMQPDKYILYTTVNPAPC